MKKILFIANYFYPDVASLGQLISDLCFQIKDEYEVSVIAAIPNYSSDIEVSVSDKNQKFLRENINGINIWRIIVPNVNKRNKLSRIKYIVKYYLNTRAAIREIKEYDIVFTVTQPPILGGMLGLYAKKKKNSRLVYNVQDFNPEQIEAVNYTKFKFIISILRWLDNRTIKASDKVLLVGRDQIPTLLKRNPSFEEKIEVINNWTDDKAIYPINKDNKEIIDFVEEYSLKDKFIVMYSGNIGLFYDLENLVKAAGHFRDYSDIRFVFIGEGAVKPEIEKYRTENNLNNIVFIPYQPKEKLLVSLNAADVHLVVNAKGIKGVSVPSKVYGVLAAGKPIVGVLEAGSEARRIIEEAQCGTCVEPQDYEGFYKLILDFYNEKEELQNIGLRGRRYLEKNLTQELSIEKYKRLFNEMT